MKHSDVVTCFHALASLLVEDGEVTEDEQAWFAAAMETMGLTPTEREAAQRIMGREELEACAAQLAPEVAAALLDALMEGALIDGDFDPQERAFIFRLAEVMAIDRATAEQSWARALRVLADEDDG